MDTSQVFIPPFKAASLQTQKVTENISSSTKLKLSIFAGCCKHRAKCDIFGICSNLLTINYARLLNWSPHYGKHASKVSIAWNL